MIASQWIYLFGDSYSLIYRLHYIDLSHNFVPQITTMGQMAFLQHLDFHDCSMEYINPGKYENLSIVP